MQGGDEDGPLEGRREKEQGMPRRRLRKLIKRLRQLQGQALTQDELLFKLGAAKKEAGKAYGLLTIKTPAKDVGYTSQEPGSNRGPSRLSARSHSPAAGHDAAGEI